MNKAPSVSRDNGGPSVFRFKATLYRHPEAEETGFLALNIPKAVSKNLHGMTKVEGTINGHPFRAPLEPNASAGHRLQVNKAMRRGADADEGDAVTLAILGSEPDPTVPADLRAPLAASQEAKSLWKDLTSMGRRDWIRWIVSAKTPETRARRVRRTVEQLSEGKRRPCCVNVYEFMLRRVQE